MTTLVPDGIKFRLHEGKFVWSDTSHILGQIFEMRFSDAQVKDGMHLQTKTAPVGWKREIIIHLCHKDVYPPQPPTRSLFTSYPQLTTVFPP